MRPDTRLIDIIAFMTTCSMGLVNVTQENEVRLFV